MKKLILLVFIFSFTTLLAKGDQDTTLIEGPWELSGFFQQNMNQISFTNWAAGGENSFSSTSQARIDAKYKSGRYSWESYADLAYGIIKTQDTPLRKNTDKIDLFSRLGRSINDEFSYTAILNFASQFDAGYKYPNDSVVVSRFMAPAYLTVSLGFDYKAFDFLSLFISPATGKFTFVTDEALSEAGAFGVDPGKKVNPEFGALFLLEFDKEVMTNVNVNSRLMLFNNYTDSDARNRRNIDVDWVTSINMPVNQYITASVGFHLIYDDDIDIVKGQNPQGEDIVGPTTQFKQQLGIGLVYNF